MTGCTCMILIFIAVIDVYTYVSQSIAKSNPISAAGIPMTCKTMPWTANGVEPAIGAEARVAIDDDKLIKYI